MILSGNCSLTLARSDPNTQAAPPMSALIASMLAEGLMETPPLQYQVTHTEYKVLV